MNRHYSDTEILDWLQKQNNKDTYSGKCIFRWSGTGKGWRLHETRWQEEYGIKTFFSVREAVTTIMEQENDPDN